MNMTLKEIREKAAEIKAVDNAEQLRDVVPFMVAGYKRVSELTRTIKAVRKEIDRLNEKASRYALAHPTCFDAEKLEASPIGVESGDITIKGSVYHFASGFGPIVREDGEMLTQEFLAALPSEWVKASLGLNMTAIMSKYGKGEKLGDALNNHGLVRSVKNVWGEKVIAANADDIGE